MQRWQQPATVLGLVLLGLSNVSRYLYGNTPWPELRLQPCCSSCGLCEWCIVRRGASWTLLRPSSPSLHLVRIVNMFVPLCATSKMGAVASCPVLFLLKLIY